MRRDALLVLLLGAWVCGPLEAHAEQPSPISRLRATARNGQVFLTWDEAETPPGTTFNVYRADRPIVDVARAEQVAHHVERHSARDWWEDPASFKRGVPPAPPVGFRIEPGRPRLDPADGLFVHTPRAKSLSENRCLPLTPASLPQGERGFRIGSNVATLPQGERGSRIGSDLAPQAGKWFFAVTATDARGKEDRRIVAGANLLSPPVLVAPGEVVPIWQPDAPQPKPGAARGKPLWLNLHAKGGVVAGMEYLLFGDSTLGWREGLPLKFSVRLERGELVVRPTDRVWINRPHDEARDGGTPAIWTFWYGYSSRIFDAKAMAQGVPTNYTERRNLWILDWVRRYYQPDANRGCCSGSSMGGCGTVSFGLRHPEWFAALHAHVPIVSYTYLGTASARRLEPCCWHAPIGPQVKTDEGLPLLDRMNGIRLVQQAQGDLPPLYLIHGRRDASIPWANNPPFYRALNDAGQAFFVYWDNGDHATCGREAPDDVRAWRERFRRYRLDESFPAFSNTSTNRHSGDGRADNGDVVGWINRGMDWRTIVDTPQRYAITILAQYPGIEYPVVTDVTLRRVQRFKTRPNERLSVRMGQTPPRTIEADADGRIRVARVVVPSSAGVELTIERAR